MKFNVLCPKDKNYVFSPLGLKYALAMVANGGDEEAVKKITELLKIKDLKKFNDEANEYMSKICER